MKILFEKVNSFKLVPRIKRKINRCLIYGNLGIYLLTSTLPTQAMGLSPIPISRPKVISIDSDIESEDVKKIVIASVKNNILVQLDLTDREIEKIYDIAVKCVSKSITNQDELLLELRGGELPEWVTKAVIGVLVISFIDEILANIIAFQPPLQKAIILKELEWMRNAQKPKPPFSYDTSSGRRSRLGVQMQMTSTPGSDKYPSSGSYEYTDIIDQLKKADE